MLLRVLGPVLRYTLNNNNNNNNNNSNNNNNNKWGSLRECQFYLQHKISAVARKKHARH